MTEPVPSACEIPAAIVWSDERRREAFERWISALAGPLKLDLASLESASADASFRHYLRVTAQTGATYIVMDAPPPQEDIRPFVHIDALIRDAGLHAPEIHAHDDAHGFMLMEDMGTRLYLTALREDPGVADRLMRDAVAALVQFQSRVDASSLPPYDDALLRRELALFPEWCVAREYGRMWTAAQQATWNALCDRLVASALAQPVVAVHRDWMPRNLMVAIPNPGILDFQDAVRGPITYDVASMLRDAFLSWDEEQEIDWAVRYWEAARKAGLPVDEDFGAFWRSLEWMGLQRHLKVLGIFCRLKHRDGKASYSQDLPRFFAYAVKVATRYRELAPLVPLIEDLVGPLTAQGYSLR